MTLWASLLTRMTVTNVAGLDECSELDIGQIVKTAWILVTMHTTFTKVLNKKHLTLDQCMDARCEQYQGNLPPFCLYNSILKTQAPRLITLAAQTIFSN